MSTQCSQNPKMSEGLEDRRSLQISCFKNCKTLTKINIPTTIEEIDNYCFEGCKSLKTFTIPSSVTFIGTDCFVNCPQLKLKHSEWNNN